MGIFSSVALGRAKQSAGNITFTKWKSKNVFKQKADIVANPRTDAQVLNRLRFSFLTLLASALTPIIKFAFGEMATDMSEFNAFQSANKGDVVTATLPDTIEVDFERLTISKGSLANTEMSSVVADESADTIVLTYPTTIVANQSANDCIAIAVLNESKNVLVATASSTPRSAGTITINDANLPAVGDKIHVYTFFIDPVTKKCSDSQYSEVTIVA
jgi:hypothetical protein